MILLIGTADTKGAELNFIADVIRAMGEQVAIVDVGTRPSTPRSVDFSSQQVATFHPQGTYAVYLSDRGQSISAMSTALIRFLGHQKDLEGVMGIGGSGGTALITPAMRSLPIGVPKLMVSTMASGNVAPYVGPSDITMMYSVTDIAGLNRISRPILTNAAGAIAGMARGFRAHKVRAIDSRPAVGLSMFGVTTPCVDTVRVGLQNDFDCLVFHATGTGGQSLEKLALSGLLAGMIDITTTEIADHLVGGVLTAGPERLDAPARTGLPYVASCGALDMVNFGHVDTVPAKFRGRKLHKHNEQVTLMRTTPEENRQIGRYIADKLNAVESALRFFIPDGGVSMLDAPGQVFHDPEADAVLFDSLTQHFQNSDTRRLIRLPYHINDPAFARSLVSAFKDLAGGQV